MTTSKIALATLAVLSLLSTANAEPPQLGHDQDGLGYFFQESSIGSIKGNGHNNQFVHTNTFQCKVLYVEPYEKNERDPFKDITINVYWWHYGSPTMDVDWTSVRGRIMSRGSQYYRTNVIAPIGDWYDVQWSGISNESNRRQIEGHLSSGYHRGLTYTETLHKGGRRLMHMDSFCTQRD